MSGASATNRLKAVEGNRIGTSSNNPVLTDQPDLRLVKLSYLVPLLLIVAGVVILLLPISFGAKFSIGFAIASVLAGTLTFSLSSHGRLREASYTVTEEYIESQTGTFEKATRRIPLSYVRDVTHRQHFFHTLFGLSDIKVTATNGDSVVLENVSDGNRKQEIIWELVLDKSPGASRLKN
jgi:uncharacterized membrane protein YdbT with pleckstrin-like domain